MYVNSEHTQAVLLLSCVAAAAALHTPTHAGCGLALHNLRLSGGCGLALHNLRLSGGSQAAPSLKDVAQRRAELAKKAHKVAAVETAAASSTWTIFRFWYAFTNKLRITGASTKVSCLPSVSDKSEGKNFYEREIVKSKKQHSRIDVKESSYTQR